MAFKAGSKSIEKIDGDFIERLNRQEHEAITTIVNAYTEQLYRTALGLGFQQTDANELVQVVWVTFFDILPQFKGRSHIRTFVFGILYNKASEMRRAQKKFQAIDDDIEMTFSSRFDAKGGWAKPPIDPEEFLIGVQTQNLIEKCLDSLPVNQRMAFSLREIDDKDSQEICNILSVTVSNLGVLLYRARNKLRECIETKTKKNGV